MKNINFIDLKKQYELNSDSINQSILSVIHESSFIQGRQVKELEQLLSDYTGSNALTVANGTDALFISLWH